MSNSNGKASNSNVIGLPFSTTPQKRKVVKTVGNEFSGTFDIPLYGYLENRENSEWQTFLISSDLDMMPLIDTKFKAVSIMLSRINGPVSAEMVKENLEDPILLDAIHDLFKGEESRWVNRDSPFDVTSIENVPKV